MAKRKQPALTVYQIEDALRKAGGFITYAAKMLNVTAGAITQRVQASEQLQIALQEIKDSHLDMCESKLLKKINAEDLGAICFYLKCQGKSRGYYEKMKNEISGPDDGPIKTDNKNTHNFDMNIEAIKKAMDES